ncbi:MAG: alpha/beta hydrolase [Bacteroides sp.]|nr:alpha/beta hydrolase [Bacteroides sp.]
MKNLLALMLFFLLFTTSLFAQSSDTLLYKQVDSTSLYLVVDYPSDFDASKTYPAIVFFFGGGWNGGNTSHFEQQARYFAERGMICFRADYRVKSRQGTTPFESLKDAKSAMRYVREHAEELHVDPEKIVASGGSAGGHLAAATALITGYNEGSDLLYYSSVPNALILFNPVMDNGPGGYGYERVGEAYPSFSPLHNIRAGAPPTILFLGTKDKLIPVETAEYYKVVMDKVGSRCEVLLYEGQGHGFFNYGNTKYYKETLSAANDFLVSLGYLGKAPEIKIK